MEADKFEKMLWSLLDDGVLSDGEKRAFKAVIQDISPSIEQLSFFRNRAFDVARQAIADHPPEAVLKWLHGVNKIIQERLSLNQSRISKVRFSPGTACRNEIISLLKQARRAVDICVFTVTDNEVSDEILAAHKRGIVVRIITDDDKSLDRGSDAERLGQSGVEVRMDSTRHHMHHKFALFDGTILLTGSYNWTRSAADHNQENLLVTDDLRLVREYVSEFERLWSKISKGEL